MKSLFWKSLAVVFFFSCGSPSDPAKLIFEDLSTQEGLIGKENYLNSPFVAAGDRVYMIGHQNGTFPDLGWHVEGEMGGIWLHPIKLLDGIVSSITLDQEQICLNEANSFINYPFSNVLRFPLLKQGLEVERLQFVPDGKEGMVVLFRFKNVDKSEKKFEFQWDSYVDLRPVWLGERTGMEDNAQPSLLVQGG